MFNNFGVTACPIILTSVEFMLINSIRHFINQSIFDASKVSNFLGIKNISYATALTLEIGTIIYINCLYLFKQIIGILI